MGRRRARARQEQLWTPTASLPVSASHPFYARLNRVLDEKKFDEFAEAICEPFYAETMGRPGLAPGIYFRLLMVGYFEGIDSERGIAWRASDSLSIRAFVRIALDESIPDHSTISRTRRLIDVETHQTVFQWVLQILAERNLLKGNTIGVDATTLEANAALRSIVRRDTGEQYNEFLTRLAKESGIETPTREELARLDRKRKKKGSNEEWQHPHDPDARITKMKDGRTHLAHKAEHAVDMETGAIVAVTVQAADEGDTSTIVETVAQAGEQIAETAAETNNEEVGERVNPEGPREVVTDKGYHSKKVVSDLGEAGVRTYCAEPKRGRQKWSGQSREQQAVYANRRRVRGEGGKRLLRQRGEKLERWNEHLYDRGGMRRVHLRGRTNILKRLVVHAGAANLGLLMRTVFGVGTPRSLQGRLPAGGYPAEQSTNFFTRSNKITFDMKMINSTLDRNQKVSPVYTPTEGFAEMVTHEGSHMLDKFFFGNPVNREDSYRTEFNAFTSQSYVPMGLNSYSAYGFWNPSWAAADKETLRSKAVLKTTEDHVNEMWDKKK